MKAAVFHGPEDVRVEEVDDPGAPGPGELLIEVRRAAICGTDSSEYLYGPQMIPLSERHPNSGHVGPMVLGHEFVGRVAAVGEGVDGFAVGDRVVSGAGISCGECDWCRAGRTNLCARYFTIGLQVDGGLAGYVSSPASICVQVPDGASDDAAAIAQPLAVALHGLRRGGVAAGQVVAIIGAGGIGSLMIGAAAERGLRELIAVDVDPQRLRTARELGASATLDAREDDVVAEILARSDGDGAHVVIDASGAPDSPGIAQRAVRRGGTVTIVGLQKAPVALDLYDIALREIAVHGALAHVVGEDLPEAVDVLARTSLADKVIDSVIPLDDLVADGLRALAEQRAKGKIVVDPTATAAG